jgi:uncharacterized protein YndB with AHSA1/START domain
MHILGLRNASGGVVPRTAATSVIGGTVGRIRTKQEEFSMSTNGPLVLRRIYPVPPEQVWELWSTPEGISSWWAPDGFTTAVDLLDLRPGGVLDYTMTATGQEQIAFMEQAGMPLATTSHKRFTEVTEPSRLAYLSSIDFVPDQAPYDHITTVTLERTEDGTEVTMEIEPMHNEEWTDRIVAGRTNELDNLERVVGLLARSRPASF